VHRIDMENAHRRVRGIANHVKPTNGFGVSSSNGVRACVRLI
jgi:hypothetical protein